ncbi:MAG TPA: M56 family metallopeptidase, partial [Blastocatellia bacterium]|nr:M56 family metallopeptidase [Blastocatellia bacterium]
MHEQLFEWSERFWPAAGNHLWQATLFALVGLAVVAVARRAPARVRCAILLLTSLKFVLPSALFVLLANACGINFTDLFARSAPVKEALPVFAQMAEPIYGFAVGGPRVASSSTGHNELFCALTIIWVTGCGVSLAFWWRRRREFSKSLGSAYRAAEGREAEALMRARRRLDTKVDLEILLSPEAVEPGVWRTSRPRIVLPEKMADSLTDAELEAVILHELVHVARRDNLTASLHMFLCCLLWFHPVVWLLDRRLLAERERACDEKVIALGGAPGVYAQSLLKVLQFCLGWKVAGVSSATGSNLPGRVEQIMRTKIDRKLTIIDRLLIYAAASALIITSIAAGLSSRETAHAESNATVSVAVESPAQEARGDDEPIRIDDLVVERQKIQDKLATTPELAINFQGTANSPLEIVSARLRAIRIEGKRSGRDHYAIQPAVALNNVSGREVVAFALEFEDPDSHRSIYFEHLDSAIKPGAQYTSNDDALNII